MKHPVLRKFCALILLMVIISMSVTGFCRSAHAADPSCDTTYDMAPGTYSAIEKQCPSCPVDEHSVPDHCDSSCHCPCHAPLTAQPVQVVCSRQIAPLVFPEPFKALPEVYLPKFIPPHILV
ncbi:MAG: hypothetical protein FD174_1555 [Geobacteraceae bacterium]|nr:MAG: hypothetical protein FD174_1555 [Geobacteraceae bacterium]